MSPTQSQRYFKTLEIVPTDSFENIKNAYRELAKRYHPDIQNDLTDMEKHERMIAINEAYTFLKTKLPEMNTEKIFDSTSIETNPPDLSLITEDPGYSDYKTGWEIFHSVHPDSWTNIRLKDLPPGSLLRDIIPYRKRMVKEAYQNLSRAYYYFSRVVINNPDSDWAYDAAEKMDKIKGLTRRYKQILKTFGVE